MLTKAEYQARPRRAALQELRRVVLAELRTAVVDQELNGRAVSWVYLQRLQEWPGVDFEALPFAAIEDALRSSLEALGWSPEVTVDEQGIRIVLDTEAAE